MIYPFEKNLNIFEEPNGGGLSSYVSESKAPKLSINIEGGFISNIDGSKLIKLTRYNKSIKDLIGILDLRLSSMTSSIKLSSYDTGTLIINLYNYPNNSSITINGEEETVILKNSNNNIYKNINESNNKIVEKLIKNSYLNTIDHYYLQLEVEKNKEYNIEISQKENNINKFDFYVISDVHGGINVAVPAIKKILRSKPDFIIAGGDIVNTGSESEYIVMNNLFSSTSVPIYPVIGNHDAWGNGSRYYSSFFGPYYYSFTYKNATFIMLNTASGVIGDSQFKWFEDELKNVKTELVFVLSHIPPINPKTGKFDSFIGITPELNSSIQSEAESNKVVALCKQYHVNYFIGAHIHRYDTIKLDDTTYLTSGVLGGAAVNSDNVGFMKISVNNNNITQKFIPDPNEYTNGVLIYLQTIQVFLIPVLRSCGIRLLIISIILIIDYAICLEFKNKLLYIKNKS